eukprot:CAMPEP_0203673674 /NCGR_PEP_ID=MMETSP0090-20130426/13541_1 /ASSEMBLY_ACC=CAM_ASM_001088 /TAXON_ID=426623 /ORGANISM="Chaetoceros affinis, Strain CCMP159" /LENGTH=519 /DNA_ID=CAMNT_0050539379 /DNA_START=167 /DNA_END=1726 /DNA_ORIENTATION=-
MPGPKVVVLYKISNVKGETGPYNAFELPNTSSSNSGGISLSSVKNSCHALRHLNRAGADGYHWRVRVDDKAPSNRSSITSAPKPKYSWWDIQDEAARLPIKQVGFTELQHLLGHTNSTSKSSSSGSGGDSSNPTKGVVRSLGKAMNKVAASVEGAASTSTFDGGPRVPILMFKLLDLMKLHDEHSNTSGGGPGAGPGYAPKSQPQTYSQPTAARTNRTSGNGRGGAVKPTQTPTRQSSSGTRGAPPRRPHQQSQTQTQQSHRAQSQKPAESLIDFGAGPAKSSSAPPSFGSAAAAKPSETRAQRLKRQYEQKAKTENRVWDEVDQRWVAVDAKNGTPISRGTTSAPPSANTQSSAAAPNGASQSKPKIKAVSLDQVNTAGKSATVAAAVQSRVAEMKTAQEDAVNRIRAAEESKKQKEAEEDIVRQKLEPKIKAWSEEHGKKKQLRALLASLHTILWEGAKWKQVNLGDLLDDRKCKLAFHKASRVVHPDKTMHLSAEERFLAKRVFDALSQAKSEFDK